MYCRTGIAELQHYSKLYIMKKIFLLFFIILSFFSSYAQNVAINADGSLPNSSAMLDVSSATKGFLPPRMTLSQRDLIITPANGLIIYQTDDVTGLYCNNGTAAVPVWQLIGPAPALNYGYFSSSSTQLTGNSIPQQLFFNLMIADGISTGNNRDFIVSKTGVYKIAYNITMETNSASGNAIIYINGVNSNTSAARQSSSGNVTSAISDDVLINLNAGDAISVLFFSFAGTVRCFARSLTINQLR